MNRSIIKWLRCLNTKQKYKDVGLPMRQLISMFIFLIYFANVSMCLCVFLCFIWRGSVHYFNLYCLLSTINIGFNIYYLWVGFCFFLTYLLVFIAVLNITTQCWLLYSNVGNVYLLRISYFLSHIVINTMAFMRL